MSRDVGNFSRSVSGLSILPRMSRDIGRQFRRLILCVWMLTCGREAASAEIDFAHEVAPILRRHCAECHGGSKAKGGFSINTRSTFLADGAAEPGKPEASRFLQLIHSADPEARMPPDDQPRVPREDIARLEAWVRSGLPWEPGFTFAGRAVYEPPLKPGRPELPPAIDGRSNVIDRIIDAHLAGAGFPGPEPIDDGRFLRRVSFDLIGLPPRPEELRAFLADADPHKRAKAVRRLLSDSIGYADHWLSFWNDLLRNDYAGVGFDTGRRMQITQWLYDSLKSNLPFDRMVRELIAPPTTASKGFSAGITWRGEASAGQTVDIQFAQNVGQVFLGINLKCASCHDSFIDRWTLDEAYGLAAIHAFKPVEIHRCDKPTGRIAKASWLFPELGQVDPTADRQARLRQLAELLVHPGNGRTTRTIVNRLWARLMGRGIVHPLDAMQSEPWSADLLDQLAVHFADQGHDLKATLELIATSAAYQSAPEILTRESARSDHVYRGPRSRQLTAEQIIDTVWAIASTGPALYDAPITGRLRPGQAPPATSVEGRWIWGAPVTPGRMPAGGERIFLRRIFRLTDEVVAGRAVATCDDEFTLYINNRKVVVSDDWTRPVRIDLRDWLRKGINLIVVEARTAAPNPEEAGFFMQADVTLGNGRRIALHSGPEWQWNPNPPAPTDDNSLGDFTGRWLPVNEVRSVGAWNRTVTPEVAAGRMPAIRASLMRNNALMQSLGRPLREQIVSSRPTELSELTAIDLFNNRVLAGMLERAGRQLAARAWEHPDQLIDFIYEYALSRKPAHDERATIRAALGPAPGPDEVEDLLWAVLMKPEFLLVR